MKKCLSDPSGYTLNWKTAYAYTKWDVSNFSFVWSKVLDDCISELNIWDDDDVETLLGSTYEVQFISHIDDRKLIYRIIPI